MINIDINLIPKNTKARPGYAMFPLFITIHNTGNPDEGATAARHAFYKTVNGGQNNPVSYHFIVDDKEIIQLIPCDEVAWHAGDGVNGQGNRKSIAIEICENVDGDIRKATDKAVQLTRYLMQKYNIPLENVVQHNKWSGKNCPAKIRSGVPYSWESFIRRCGEVEENEMEYYETLEQIPEGELRDTISDLVTMGVIKGTGTGLHLSEDMVRMLVFLRRAKAI